MYVAALKVSILIQGSRSLKDKRQVVRSILDTVRSRKNVSAAEVGSNDRLQVAELGFGIVNGELERVRECVDWIINFIEVNYDVDVLRSDVQWLKMEEEGSI
ncbi:DUF503 domain-containing protein [Coprothermobacteraceae bacterium]|nr:DUF503 domain-containing protein [Coprothermobacteraceae bacterium]